MAKAKKKKKNPITESEATPGLGEFEKKIDNIMGTLEKKVTKQMVDSLDVEETVQSMAGEDKKEQKEHLTISHGSYNMLVEMVENLMSEE